MVKLTGLKGGVVWVSAGQVTHLAALEASGSSLYGSNNSPSTTRLQFAGGEFLDVREPAEEVATLLDER